MEMFDKKGILAVVLIVGSVILLILNLVKDGSIYAILSNILLIVAMVFVLFGNRKNKNSG